MEHRILVLTSTARQTAEFTAVKMPLAPTRPRPIRGSLRSPRLESAERVCSRAGSDSGVEEGAYVRTLTVTVEVSWPKGKLTLARLEREIHRAAMATQGRASPSVAS